MTTKMLPLAESPIRGYMMYSYHLAVTMSHIDAWPWFFTNYVQLQCNPAQLELPDFLDFSTTMKGEIHFTEGTSPYNPWLRGSTQLEESEIIAGAGSISEYVENGISNDFYVETFVDEYHIQQLFNGQNTHFRHRLLVFGFDKSSRTFDIVGFDKNSQCRKLKCTYAELDAAFNGVSPQIPDRTRLFNPLTRNILVNFDRSRFADVLQEYLSSRNSLLNPDLRGDLKKDTELWYGLKTYDFLSKYLEVLIERKSDRDSFDFRGFHTVWEHKKCMLDRLKWLAVNDYDIPHSLISQYAKVVSFADVICSRVVMIRRGLLPLGKGHLKTAMEMLDSAKQLESEVLYQVLSIFKQ